MMRRFSRKRRSAGEAMRGGIDAKESLSKILEAGVVDAKTLEPDQPSDVPDTLAAIGRGEREDGSPLLVAYSPRSATEALLAGLAAANRLESEEEESFTGTVYVVAAQWTAGARRVLSLLGQTSFSVEAVAAAQLSESRVVVDAERELPMLAANYQQVAARMTSAESRTAFNRAATALEGLAAKHGGAVRTAADRLELVVLARRAATIRADGQAPVLETQLGGRQATPLSGSDLAAALDGLEGQIRRRIGDRKVREGEEGLRGRVVAQLAAGDELRGVRPWPQPGADLDQIDAVAVNSDGQPVVVAVREEFEWTALASVLEALAPLASLSPVLFAEVGPPLKLGTARLLLVGERFGDGLERALACLANPFELRGVSGTAGQMTSRASGEGAEARSGRRGRRRGGRSGRNSGRDGAGRGSESEGDDAALSSPSRRSVGAPAAHGAPSGPRADQADQDESVDDSGRGRGRRRRRSRRGRGASGDSAEAGSESDVQDSVPDAESEAEDDDSPRRTPRKFEEISLMDLDAGPSNSEATSESDRTGSRSRRGRRRGRRGSTSDSSAEGSLSGGEAEESEVAPRIEEEDLVDSDDLEEILARLSDDVPDFESTEEVELPYDDDEEGDEAAGDSDRSKRTPARLGPQVDEGEERPAQRRRSAIVVHADRDSLFAAMLLARDARQIDGIWAYPQSELMTFFRSVATDLRDDVPIVLIGFSPSPARDVVQAASLYRGRLTWFDRQVWPPEDLMAVREALGADSIHGGEELDSSLPLVLESNSRRSRFSDKLVDLATGRFTQHDFERWGRLWWWRAGEIAGKSGDIRSDIAPILSGRPSDLTKEAALLDVPPAPEEVAYVAEKDFRLVHFGGHKMVVVPVEGAIELHLAARIARERYRATLSLSYREGGEIFVFGGDELIGRRALDYGAVVEHLSTKLEWIEAGPDADHVARFRVRDVARHPERLEELIAEIAMGRALLER